MALGGDAREKGGDGRNVAESSTSQDHQDVSYFQHQKANLTRRSSLVAGSGAIAITDEPDITTDDDIDMLDHSQQLRVLLAGGIAGCVAKSVTAPLSRLTILFQVHSMLSTKGNIQYATNLSEAVRKVIRKEGLLAFWKGNGTSIVHRFPYSAANFLAYENFKLLIRKYHYDDGKQEDPLIRFMAGAGAGMIATSTCYPLDLIRTRLATQPEWDIRYRGISHAFSEILRVEGFRGMYRGLLTTLCVTVPNLAINYSLYETLREYLIRHNLSHGGGGLSIVDSLGCGAGAGIVSSTLTFPVDVIRRRMQLQGLTGAPKSPAQVLREVISQQGFRGLYRGLQPELLKVIPMVGITFGTFEYTKNLLSTL